MILFKRTAFDGHSGTGDKVIQHHFAACFVEVDGQFIAVDVKNAAISKFDMKNTVALQKGAG